MVFELMKKIHKMAQKRRDSKWIPWAKSKGQCVCVSDCFVRVYVTSWDFLDLCILLQAERCGGMVISRSGRFPDPGLIPLCTAAEFLPPLQPKELEAIVNERSARAGTLMCRCKVRDSIFGRPDWIVRYAGGYWCAGPLDHDNASVYWHKKCVLLTMVWLRKVPRYFGKTRKF